MEHEPSSMKTALPDLAMASARNESDDDWETADLDNFAPPKRKAPLAAPLPLTATQPGPGPKILSRPSAASSSSGADTPANLRPSAPAFQPRPQQSGAKLAWRGSAGAGPGMDQDEWYRDPVGRGSTSNRTIWETANKSAPPVTLIASNNVNDALLPPPPSIKILRRPSPTNPVPQRSNSASSDDRKKTLEQRELEYQKARERIFASSGGESVSAPGSKRNSPSPKPLTASKQPPGVLRQPRGPDEGKGAGFGVGLS